MDYEDDGINPRGRPKELRWKYVRDMKNVKTKRKMLSFKEKTDSRSWDDSDDSVSVCYGV